MRSRGIQKSSRNADGDTGNFANMTSVGIAGAHNTIVTARAGKDLVSCLVSGLLTIGPRFGGAVDDAARYFQDACDRGTPGQAPFAPPPT